MKLNLYVMALLSSGLLLSACGGGLADGSSKDTDDMKPVAGVEDESARPRPPANAPVIKTDEHFIYDVNNQKILLRGVNHLYNGSAATRLPGIDAIADTDANVVRLQISEATTELEFEAAMSKVVANNLVALVTLTASDNRLTCTEDNTYLLNAIDQLWLKKFLPVLVQDRFQPHLMINIANGWGVMEIFNEDSLGYQEYIDTYKALIRKFRNAGFKLPLVIDAPSCGQDFNAFLKGRSRELMAADVEKNLVFGVHVDGAKWNTPEEVINAATVLYNEKVPFIVTEFTGSGFVTDDATIDHLDLMQKAVGDQAVAFNVPWTSTADAFAYSIALPEVMDLERGAVVQVDVFLDKIYSEYELNENGRFVPKGKLSFALYVEDQNGNQLKAGSVAAAEVRSNQWNKLEFNLPSLEKFIDSSNLMNESTSFDLTAVAKIGIQVLANGKPVSLNKPIKFDNLSILPGAASMYKATFNESNDEWILGWGDAVVGRENGALTVMPQSGEAVVQLAAWNGPGISTIAFNKPLVVAYRMYIPDEYEGTISWGNIFAQFGGGWEWHSTGFPVSSLVAGEWQWVVANLGFNETVSPDIINSAQSFGLQLGFSGSYTQPILIDEIKIFDPTAKPTKTVTSVQWSTGFSRGSTEGFVNAGWDGGSPAISVVDGALAVAVPTGAGGNTGAINKGDINSISEIDFRGGVTVKMKLFVPADWSGDDYEIKPFMQDGSWQHYQYATLTDADINEGEWNELTFVLSSFPEGFSRTLKPQMFGIQYDKVNGGTFMVDDIEIVGDIQVNDSQPVFQATFSTQEQIDQFTFDFAAGGLTESAMVTAKYQDWSVIPFGWTASSWRGEEGERAVLDISQDDDLVNLTERGEEIVNGDFGIRETSQSASF